MRNKTGRWVPIILVLVILFLSSLPVLTPSSAADDPADSDGDGLSDLQEEAMGTDINESRDPGLYCLYKERYRTRDYRVWQDYSSGKDRFWISTDSVVVRRGTTLKFGGFEGGNREVAGSKDGLTGLSADDGEVDIPDNCTVGRYTYRVSQGE